DLGASAAQGHIKTAVDPEIHLLDELEVDDLRPVGTKEAFGIQALLDSTERASDQRMQLAPPEAHVVVLRADQTNLPQWYEPAARTVLHEQLLQHTPRRGHRCAGVRDLQQGGRETLGLDGLQQIIQCVNLKSSQRVLIISGREDHSRYALEAR